MPILQVYRNLRAHGLLQAWVVALAVGSVLASLPAATASVPLPRPRPAEIPAAVPQTPPQASDETKGAPAEPATPEASACRKALTDDIAIAPSIAPIRDAGGCGGEDLVRLEAVVLRDGRRVGLKPAATLRCEMARAVADWIRDDAATLAQSLGSELDALDNFDSYSCRGRNRVKGAKLSEHGKANALDVRSLDLADGRKLSLTDRALSREVREKVLWSVCTRFTTVLGPGSDWYHEDHIHLDIAQRRNDYKLCQWDIYEPLPATPPFLPAERPDDAPERVASEPSKGEADVDNAESKQRD